MKIIQEQALTLFNDPSKMTEEQKSSHRMKEQQLDTSRAYSLLLYHANVKGRKESIIEELKAEVIPKSLITKLISVFMYLKLGIIGVVGFIGGRKI